MMAAREIDYGMLDRKIYTTNRLHPLANFDSNSDSFPMSIMARSRRAARRSILSSFDSLCAEPPPTPAGGVGDSTIRRCTFAKWLQQQRPPPDGKHERDDDRAAISLSYSHHQFPPTNRPKRCRHVTGPWGRTHQRYHQSSFDSLCAVPPPTLTGAVGDFTIRRCTFGIKWQQQQRP
ncbi:unnamed protein product [Sphagnum balticum]